jgi:hypothetical protein
MAHRYLKDAGIAAIALATSFGVAQAAAPTPPPPPPSELAALIKRNADGSLPQRGGIKLPGATPAASNQARTGREGAPSEAARYAGTGACNL